MDPLQPMRTIKHHTDRALRRGESYVRDRVVLKGLERLAPPADQLAQYTHNLPEVPFDNFLDRGVEHRGAPLDIPALRIFLLWTGTNALTGNRSRNLEVIHQIQAGIQIELVTPSTLDEWIVDGHPLHDTYETLSLVHRSDYLRCYFMHHHGGGYSDLKAPLASWREPFDTITKNSTCWLLGYPEISSRATAPIHSPVGRRLKQRHALIAGNGAFIARPHSPFTADWLDEVHNRLDYYRRALRRHPAVDPFGREGGYPVPWSVLQGQVFQPLQLKYHKHVQLTSKLKLEFSNYR